MIFESWLDFFVFFYSFYKNIILKQKSMIINFIYTILLLIAGSVVAALILLFGVKFCKNNSELRANPTWRDIFLQMVRGYPFWLWLIVFLAVQPAIVHIINAWYPALWTVCDWIPNISDFIAFIVVGFFMILVKITDNNGKLKKNPQEIWMKSIKKPPSYSKGVFNFEKLFLN